MRERIKRLFIPYLFYVFGIGIAAICIQYFVLQDIDKIGIIKRFVQMVWGGRYLNKLWVGPCWYLSCYLGTFIIVLLVSRVGNVQLRWIIYFICFGIGHIEAWCCPNLNFPLSLDTSLVGVMWYAIGYEMKSILKDNRIRYISACVVVIFIILRNFSKWTFIYSYGLEIFNHYNKYMILDIIIPIAFTEVVWWISKIISEKMTYLTLILSEISKYTIPIMAMHVFVNKIFIHMTHIQSELLCVIVGVVFPYFVAKHIYPIVLGNKKRYIM